MQISVNHVPETGWVVQLDACAIPFRCQASAEQFARLLRQRLEAPHVLPEQRRSDRSAEQAA
ncbi:hypothetical protein IB229_16170 [Pseudomonas sp. PDM14]|uniref:hypothetical protein n=1 Tax=Pseudomonas sp. PDM14 TaxID=2769288 RepID=UPI0017829347|nr:hypothetical protein [Pseudomonas sp. PDM14]MBD9484522.1 hypothetical protein [Pseudomonas sp. PDM14]